MVRLAQQSPLLEIRELDVARLDAEDTFRVTLVVHNVGYLPTNITQRTLDSRVAVPVRARLELVDSELLSGSKRLDLGHITGSRDTAGPRGRHESRRSLEWVVRRTGPRAELRVVVVSEKGGTVRREVELR
jgi:hypothetical protein